MAKQIKQEQKLVALDTALVQKLVILAERLGLESPNQVLNLLIRPIYVQAVLRGHAKRMSVQFVTSGTEPEILLKFLISETFVLGSVKDYARKFEKFRRESGQNV